jgi:UDPglucose 6-dehydrogenase
LTLIDKVLAAGGVVQAYDPKAAGEIRRIYGERPDLALFNSASAAVVNADALVICTDWDEFRSVHLPALAGALTTRVVVDGRNLFDPGAAQEAGLSYFGVGRGLSLEDAEHASNSSETPHFQQHRRSMSLDGAGS